jgi:predicted phosphodiesterase
MKVAIISDIHGNMEAFERVLADIASLPIEDIISLGDNIGYGPEPDSVIKRIQRIPSSNESSSKVSPRYRVIMNWP